ncbi:MAG TPA: glycosyltransferase [Armatimonadota bacterium]|nr:glycosyltransferase [Armatimonadota bacterium]
MNISALVCTRNRPELVRGCLEAMAGSPCPDLEIVVVDQSTDSAELAAVDRRIRYIHSATVGLSRARDIGVQQSSGDVVAFTDDDCVPDKTWAAAILKEFAENQDISAIYGRTLPYEQARRRERQVAIKSDAERRIFSRRCNPWRLGHGNNMAFRRRVFEVVGPFDEALGPGGLLRNCDDADFTYRLLKAGFKALYSPEPLVYHRQFRHGEDLWRLERGYSIGAGALCWKHLRCGDKYALKLLLDRWGKAGAAHIIYGLLTGKPTHIRLGWYRIVYSIMGMWKARAVPIDVSRRVFLDPGAGGRSNEQSLCGHMYSQ